MVAAFELPKETTCFFVSLGKKLAITSTSPSISHLAVPSEKGRNWLNECRKSFESDVQGGLAACYFHVQRIESIERQLAIAALECIPELKMLPGTGYGSGNTRVLDIEYQAAYFALRRTLEYTAVATAAFFRSDCHRIKALDKTLANREPAKVRQLVEEVLHGLPTLLPGLISEDRAKSRGVRDKLAHWESIAAGTLNISCHSDGVTVGLAGGGEELNFWFDTFKTEIRHQNGLGVLLLGPLMRRQLVCVEALVRDLVRALGLDGTVE